MITFQCIPMPTEVAERFRRIGHDDNGIKFAGSSPRPAAAARHLLDAKPDLLREAECVRAEARKQMAQVVRSNSLISVRA